MNSRARLVILPAVTGLLHRDVLDFLAVILAGAAFVVTHYVVARRLLGDPESPRILRLLAIVPPLTPFVAFYLRKRWASFVWLGVLAIYVAIRIVTA